AQSLEPTTYRRNGFMPVDFELALLSELSHASRTEWRAAIEKRAQRIERLATKSPRLLMQSRAQAMISAAGDVGRFAWIADAITPEVTDVVATPWRRETFNLVTWSRGDRQALSVCGDRDHPLHAAEQELFGAWEAAHDDA